MDWRFTSYSLAYLITALIAALTGWLVWQRRSQPGTTSLALLMLAVVEWSLSACLESSAVDVGVKITWSKIEYLGASSTVTLFLLFTLDYLGRAAWLTPLRRAFLWLGPIIISLLAFTNEWHGLIWPGVSPVLSGTNLIIYRHGPAFWAIVIYYYTVVLITASLLWRHARRTFGHLRRQALLIAVSSCLPLIGALIYLISPEPLAGLDLTPISFAFVGVAVAWSIFRHRLFDLAPVAHTAIFDNMGEGIVVLDMRQRIVEINPAARHLLDVDITVIGETTAALPIAPGILAGDLADGVEVELSATRILGLRSYPLIERQRATGRLLVIRDITAHQQAQRALQALNANLEEQVSDRTAELRGSISELESEIHDRQRVERELRQMRDTLAQRVAELNHKLTTLYELIVIGQHSRPDAQLLPQSLNLICDALSGEAACLHTWPTDSDVLTLTAAHGLSATGRTALETLTDGWVPTGTVPLAATDLARDERLPANLRQLQLGACLIRTIRLPDQTRGLLSVFWAASHRFDVQSIAVFSAMADQLSFVLEHAQLRRQGEAAAAEQERHRLARDLHDSVTQSINSLLLIAEAARYRATAQPNRLGETLDHLVLSARQALREMRLLLFELRPALLSDTGLIAALQSRFDTVERRSGVGVDFSAPPEIALSPDQATELFWIIIEALNNSLKHAQASHVDVKLTACPDGWQAEVADNGRGFDVAAAAAHPTGLGLRSMRERAESLGGTVALSSHPNRGTTVTIYLPRID